MKYLYLSFVVVLFGACGSETRFQDCEVSDTTITFGDFEVMLNDLTKDWPEDDPYNLRSHLDRNFTWHEAKKACEDLGEGWRLPTIEELKIICGSELITPFFGDEAFDNRMIFSWQNYWSADEVDKYNALVHSFDMCYTFSSAKIPELRSAPLVKAVRGKKADLESWYANIQYTKEVIEFMEKSEDAEMVPSQ